jgi:protein-L-isoaspartate O-methyltransferase
MAVFSSLQPAELARQLANPEGPVGIEIAEWLNGKNREGNARALALLEVQAGCHVLEIGFGNGRAAPNVIGQAGFRVVDAENLESERITPNGAPTKRYTIRVTARY